MSRGPIPDKPADRPTIPEVVARFAAYYRQNPAWGSLHVVMDDGNWNSVEWCRDYAQREGDAEGAALAEILLQMTKTQMRKLEHQAVAMASNEGRDA